MSKALNNLSDFTDWDIDFDYSDNGRAFKIEVTLEDSKKNKGVIISHEDIVRFLSAMACSFAEADFILNLDSDDNFH